jgi:FKBP-type peptidyl-prolyl cis-trans isomerase SlpA
MTEVAIGPGTRVTLHFAIKLPDGVLIDGNFDAPPASFTFGDGTLPEGFEQALLGLRAGDHVELTIAPERGFGHHNPANIQTRPRGQFREMELEVGLVVLFQEPGGELPGVVVELDADTVRVDFNHPLAGKTLLFEVQVERVEAT